MQLTISQANTKLRKTAKALGITARSIGSIDLPAGWACPAAHECKAWAVQTPEGVRIRDAEGAKYRCYAASAEVTFPSVYAMRRRNLETLRKAETTSIMAALIVDAVRREKKHVVRFHSSGDFFNRRYADAWIQAAKQCPNVVFYGYTKMFPLFLNRRLPENFRLTVSVGGLYDRRLPEWTGATVRVFPTATDVPAGLPIDTDDTHAVRAKESFALTVHGTQPRKDR